MRTTLDIADDVLVAAKEIARRERKSLGETISELVRKSFAQCSATPYSVSARLASYGIHPLPARSSIVSTELINRLRDAEGI